MEVLVEILIQTHVTAMDKIFELLVNKLQKSLHKLNMGGVVSTKEISEMWTLLHHLHFASYDSNSGDLLNKLIEYYE